MRVGGLPYLQLTDFLDSETCKDLLDWVLNHECKFSASQINYGDAGGSLRRSKSAVIEKPLLIQLKVGVERRLPEILKALGMPSFVHCFELALVAYNQDDHFKLHVDHRGDILGDMLQPRIDRRISAVYYFHKMPKAFSGGQLRIYPLLSGTPIVIEPDQNTLVAFPSFAPHEVLPVSCPSGAFENSRFAVNIWVHAEQSSIASV